MDDIDGMFAQGGQECPACKRYIGQDFLREVMVSPTSSTSCNLCGKVFTAQMLRELIDQGANETRRMIAELADKKWWQFWR